MSKVTRRPLETSDSPFEYSLNLDDDRGRAQIEAISGIENFASSLAKNRTRAFLVIRDDTILEVLPYA